MNLNELNNLPATTSPNTLMPVLFIGHGSPMNAIEDNEFTACWQSVGASLPKPGAILCISAHWETRGTMVTAMPKPRTIHDFCGFPDKLFLVQYPAPGSPQIAFETRDQLLPSHVEPDQKWGLDHGCWSVLKHMFPKADIPVLQLSLDHTLSPEGHYLLAKQLSGLRRKGILVMGSGNIVHNLRTINWHNPAGGHEWALEANEKLKKFILGHDHKALVSYQTLDSEIQLSVPTPEHFLPLLYALALREEHETVSPFNDNLVYGSISMTSIKIN
jgi:4,5-DOPA dioxygenase extradiol